MKPHKRKLIGIVKVYRTVVADPACTTYETVWPVGLYRKFYGIVPLKRASKP